MADRNFRQLLTDRQKTADTLVCVGLDPLVDKLPAVVRRACPSDWSAVSLWMREIVDATAPFASMFKPQHAHWEAFDGGAKVLRALIDHIHYKYPDIPVFLDCKRGDIDRTQRQYREAHFTLEGVDGMNYNGYMGKDTLRSLIDKDHPGRALVGLGRTSNPEAWEIQDEPMKNGQLIWEKMVSHIYAWSREFGVIENAGVVMGAAHKDPHDPVAIYSQHLALARTFVGNDLWFLIPGIGKQQGFVRETMAAAYRGAGSITINSSSEIDFASSGPDFAEAAARVTKNLRDEINQCR